MLHAEAARQIAIQRHVGKEHKIEIDPGCEVAVVERGIYVQAWVFVSSKDIAAELTEEDAA